MLDIKKGFSDLDLGRTLQMSLHLAQKWLSIYFMTRYRLSSHSLRCVDPSLLWVFIKLTQCNYKQKLIDFHFSMQILTISCIYKMSNVMIELGFGQNWLKLIMRKCFIKKSNIESQSSSKNIFQNWVIPEYICIWYIIVIRITWQHNPARLNLKTLS